MWISQENEHSRWQKSHQSPKKNRQKEAVRLTFSFPRASRLLNRADFIKTSKRGTRYYGDNLVIDYHFANNTLRPKLGISVSRKFGSAVLRNRFKRCLREAFRLKQYLFPKNLYINVIPKSSLSEISRERCSLDLQLFLDTLKAPT